MNLCKKSDIPGRAFHGWRGEERFPDLIKKTDGGHHQGAGRSPDHDEQKSHGSRPQEKPMARFITRNQRNQEPCASLKQHGNGQVNQNSRGAYYSVWSPEMFWMASVIVVAGIVQKGEGALITLQCICFHEWWTILLGHGDCPNSFLNETPWATASLAQECQPISKCRGHVSCTVYKYKHLIFTMVKKQWQLKSFKMSAP